jgi:hypothetical protein
MMPRQTWLAGLPTDKKKKKKKRKKEKEKALPILFGWEKNKSPKLANQEKKKKNLKYLICFFVTFFNQNKKREKFDIFIGLQNIFF